MKLHDNMMVNASSSSVWKILSEVPLIVQLIMKIISSVGYSVGKGPLDGIKELAEDEESQQRAASHAAAQRP